MITLHDMNQSWTPPEGFALESVHAQGAYLVVIYVRHQQGNDVVRGGSQYVTIYLQDMGREVMRTMEDFLDPVASESKPEPKPIARRFKVWNGFLIALQGIGEMFT